MKYLFFIVGRRRTARFATALLAFIGSAATLSAACDVNTSSPGCVHFEIWTNSGTDQYTNAPTPSQQLWFQDEVWRMKVTPGYWDSRLSWYPNAWAYIDSYAIYPGSDLYTQHPEWITHDVNGNELYIQYDCSAGHCSQFAGDISNPAYRNYMVDNARAVLSKGYKGLWLDDVNLVMRTSDGYGNFVAPRDPATGVEMTATAWEKYFADYMTQFREAFPNVEILHNALWFAGSGSRGSDPYVQQEIKAANYIDLERGATDPNLTGDNGPWSIQELLRYVDIVHSLGSAVVYWDYNAASDYSVGAYLLANNGKDGYGARTSFFNPLPWPVNVDLGDAQGDRYPWNNLIRRDFAEGLVLLNPPGGATTTVQLPGTYTDGSGHVADSITLYSNQGAILMGHPAPPVKLNDSFHVNACGPTVGAYPADVNFRGGHCDKITQNIDLSKVRYPCPELLYQSKRTTNPGDTGFSYVIENLAPLKYHLRLDFAEDRYSPGERLFNVTVNGKPFLTNFDINVAAGGRYKGVEKDYYWIQPDEQGKITIQFTNVRGNALLNGITLITW
jgi:hypothetical protein